MLKKKSTGRPRRVSSISRKQLPARIHARSAAATRACGKQLARLLRPGDVVLLTGPVGSGKTTFAQGVAAGLGIRDYLRSSSFILVNEYAARGKKLYHIDLYRLEGQSFDSFGLEEYVAGDGICLIEWADKIAHFPVDAYWNVDVRPRNESTRDITVSFRHKIEKTRSRPRARK